MTPEQRQAINSLGTAETMDPTNYLPRQYMPNPNDPLAPINPVTTNNGMTRDAGAGISVDRLTQDIIDAIAATGITSQQTQPTAAEPAPQPSHSLNLPDLPTFQSVIQGNDPRDYAALQTGYDANTLQLMREQAMSPLTEAYNTALQKQRAYMNRSGLGASGFERGAMFGSNPDSVTSRYLQDAASNERDIAIRSQEAARQDRQFNAQQQLQRLMSAAQLMGVDNSNAQQSWNNSLGLGQWLVGREDNANLTNLQNQVQDAIRNIGYQQQGINNALAYIGQGNGAADAMQGAYNTAYANTMNQNNANSAGWTNAISNAIGGIGRSQPQITIPTTVPTYQSLANTAQSAYNSLPSVPASDYFWNTGRSIFGLNS